MKDRGLRRERRNELLAGLVVLAVAAALAAGLVWVTGSDVGGGGYRVYASTGDAARVSRGSRVYLLGMDVGSVRGVQLTRRGVVLSLELDADVSLPADSRVELETSGFPGTRMVRLVPGGAEARLTPGDTLPADPSLEIELLANHVGERVEIVLRRAARAFSDSALQGLESGADDLVGTLAVVRRTVREERRTLSELLESLERTSDNLERAASGPELDRARARTDSLARTLRRTDEALGASRRSLSSILEKVESGSGSLGRLARDERLRHSLSALRENLQAASREMSLLEADVREHPDRYLREMRITLF